MPRQILALCHGNVCRSPYLAAVLQRDLAHSSAAPVILSAGFVGPGRAVPSHAALIGARHGVDLSGHRSTLVTPALMARSDLVLVMDAVQADKARRLCAATPPRIIVLGDLDPEWPNARTVRDPWNGDESAFEESYTRIDRCVRVLVSAMRGISVSENPPSTMRAR
ncbi:MAG TPA: hypothetical protein VJU87_05265 [Gemmatimonadaceae bacterium]|nr:hypothetical protein [Gemmatimonadaceae bacterium]